MATTHRGTRDTSGSPNSHNTYSASDSQTAFHGMHQADSGNWPMSFEDATTVIHGSAAPTPVASATEVSSPADPPAPVIRSAASPANTVQLGFVDGLEGWNVGEVGGSAEGKGTVTAGSAVLREGDSFL